MDVLIVESRSDLGAVWQQHLERHGMTVVCAATQTEAIAHLTAEHVDIIVLDLVLENDAALAIADYASYRQPEAKVIFVTSTSFFSDGSIFSHSANARAIVAASTPPEDLVAMIEHYATHPV